MKSTKMFTFVAMVIGALMAFGSAGAASAITPLEEVVLCKTLEDPCAEGNSFPEGTVLHGKSIGIPVLLGGVNVECEKSEALGKTTSSYAHGQIESLSWTNCKEENGQKEPCTVTTQHLPYLTLALLTTDHKNYHAVVTETTKGRPAAKIKCPEVGDCSFGAKEVLFEVSHEGTNKAVLLTVLQALSGEGVCFFLAGTWHAKYEVKCLNAEAKEVGCWPEMKAAEEIGPELEEVVLCKALEDPCENGHFGTGTVVHATASDPVVLGTPNLLCASSKATGESTGLLLVGKITSLSWSGCETSNKEACTATSVNLPYAVKGQLQTSHAAYEVLVSSGGIGRPSAFITCGSKECSYGASSILFEVLDVSGATVIDALQTLTGIGICFFAEGVWHAKYEVKCLSGGSEVNCYPSMESEPVKPPALSLEQVVLCKALEDPCQNGHFRSGTVLHGKSTDPTLLGVVNILCETSTVLGNESSLFSHGKLTALSWVNCKEGEEECTITTQHLPYLVLALLTSDHKSYHVVVTEAEAKGRPAAKVVCPQAVCSYGAKELLFEVLHEGVGKAAVLNLLQELSGEGLCFFTSGVWHAKYEVECLDLESKEVGCWPAMKSDSVLKTP